jgi:hypothetical protein
MEKRNAHKMTEDRDVFKLATEKMHEGKQAAEVFKKYSGISEESYGKIIQSHMQLMREAKAGETTSYSSTNFSVMIITSENGTVEAHVIRPLEKIYGYGLVKDGENSLLALDKCQNFSPIHEIAEEKDVVEYLLQLES